MLERPGGDKGLDYLYAGRPTRRPVPPGVPPQPGGPLRPEVPPRPEVLARLWV